MRKQAQELRELRQLRRQRAQPAPLIRDFQQSLAPILEIFQIGNHLEPLYVRFWKQHPSMFEGSVDPWKAEHWMSMMGTIMDFTRVEGNDRVACATYMLRDDARIWWEESKVDEFATLNQGNMMVTKYALKFDRLAKFAADLVPTNATRVDRFVQGLKPMIARDVEIVSVGPTIHMLKFCKGPSLLREWKTEYGRKMLLKDRKEWVRYPECDKCKKHHQDEFWANTCYGCGKKGCIKRNCPQKTREWDKEHHKKNYNLVPTCVFALTKPQAEASTSVVLGQIFIAGIDYHVLIDYGATHSFVAKRIAERFNRPHEKHAKWFGTMLPTREVVISRKWFRVLPLRIDGRELYEDLIGVDNSNFDIILGMDWLTKYKATIDCKKKMVVFKPDGEEPFLFMGTETRL
ncbi:uncharacterized protein LOC133813952 [Humulus lupulus]|uniref:uncharacterized protein LOC133813952 n=1 Tax=Humulus lupulus TaxID=3486 RepID=UPI002B415197|nr:uncharacterized protein LOC133813952 [Humulus lupulus]